MVDASLFKFMSPNLKPHPVFPVRNQEPTDESNNMPFFFDSIRLTPSTLIQKQWHRLSHWHQYDIARVLTAAGNDKLAITALELAQRNGLAAEVSTVIFFAGMLKLAHELSTSNSSAHAVLAALETYKKHCKDPQVLVSSLSTHEVALLSHWAGAHELAQGFSFSVGSETALLKRLHLSVKKMQVKAQARAVSIGRASGLWRAEAYNRRHPFSDEERTEERVQAFVKFSLGVNVDHKELETVSLWVTNKFQLPIRRGEQLFRNAREILQGISDRMGLGPADLSGLESELRVLLSRKEIEPNDNLTALEPPSRQALVLLQQQRKQTGITTTNRQSRWRVEDFPEKVRTLLSTFQRHYIFEMAELKWETLVVLAYWTYSNFDLQMTASGLALDAGKLQKNLGILMGKLGLGTGDLPAKEELEPLQKYLVHKVLQNQTEMQNQTLSRQKTLLLRHH